jgi:hypothetical protein
MEALRPQAVMTLCEILHHCRKALTLEQLARVVRLMTGFIVDQVRGQSTKRGPPRPPFLPATALFGAAQLS